MEYVSSLPQGYSVPIRSGIFTRQREINGIVQVLLSPCLRGAGPERKSQLKLLFALQMLSVSSS